MFDKTALRTGPAMMAVLAALVVIAKMGVIYAEITCEAPAVRTGDPAYIICLFDVDVSVAKKNIKVQRRSLTSARFDPDKTDTVLDCYWQNVADFSCQFGNGFKLVGEAGRTAVVRIASVSKNDEQVYMCEVVPSDPTNIQTCTLTVRDPPAYVGNFSHINVVRERLEDDTATVKGIVTATISIIICVIVILALVVLLVLFRDQLKDQLQLCYTRCRSPQGGEGDPEGAGMLCHSNDHAGDEGKTKENAKEKKKIDRYIRILKTMKQAGELDAFYKVSHSDEKEKTESDLATGSDSLPDRRNPFNDKTVASSEVKAVKGASASKEKEMLEPSELQESIEFNLANDPEGLLITITEWHERELAEINRRKEEVDAQKHLYTVRERHKKEIREKKEEDRKRGITDPHEDPKRRKRRQEQELNRHVEDSAAVTKLDTIIKRHEEERTKQKEQDKKRVENAKKELMMKEKKWSPPEEGTKTSLLTPVPVNDGGADKDTKM